MIDAMSRAYARRFTVEQMAELRTFFTTPTGRAYMAQATTIMSDPDIAAWQQQMMNSTMTRVMGETRKMVAELIANQGKPTP